MSEALLLALALLAGVDLGMVALLGAGLWMPVPTALLLVGVAVGGRRAEARGAERDLRFVETVVGELRAGSSLRVSLRVACGDDPAYRGIRRRLEVGLPLPTCVDGLGQALPTVGRLVESAVAAGADGGRMLPIFEEMVVYAAAESDAIGELRAATAQVRASMTVLVGLPVIYLAWSASTGRLAALLALPGGAIVATIGATLFVLGVGVMVTLAKVGR